MKRTWMVVAGVALAAGLAGAAAWQEPDVPRARPEQEHDFLKNYVGQWEFTQRIKTGPEGEWIEMTGTQTGRMIGDLWVILEWKSDLEGAPMNGAALVGYDPKKEKFVSSYVDSMNSAMATGEAVLERKTLTTQMSTSDPRTGKPTKMRMVERLTEKDKMTWEMYSVDKDGNEYQCSKGEAIRRK